jgi:hypothetical protein
MNHPINQKPHAGLNRYHVETQSLKCPEKEGYISECIPISPYTPRGSGVYKCSSEGPNGSCCVYRSK